MLAFPYSSWQPTAAEYFAATAPDKSILHGSGRLKRFEDSPRVYGATWVAEWMRELYPRAGGGLLPAEVVALLKSLEPTAAMRFGSAVEYYAFPASGEPLPDVSATVRRRAHIRAVQIRSHPEAGRWITADGAAYQVAHRWQDPASGLWLRKRLDVAYHSEVGPAELDLKIWSGVTDWRIKFMIRDHGADLQAAIYRRGQMDLWGVALPRTLVVAGPGIQDKIFVRKLHPDTLKAADYRLSNLLDRLAAAYQSCTFTDPEEVAKEMAA